MFNIKKCADCLETLKDNDIISKNVKSYILKENEKKELQSNFKKWTKTNHPDKGGNLAIFQTISSCIDLIAKENKCDFGNEGYKPEEPPKKSYSYKISTIEDFNNKIKHPAIITISDPTLKQFNILTNSLNLSTYLYYKLREYRFSGNIINVMDPKILKIDTVYSGSVPNENLFLKNTGDFHLLTVSSAERERLLKHLGISETSAPKGLNKCATVICPRDKIYNPATGKCVLRTGVIGKKILKETGNTAGSKPEPTSSKASPKASPKGKCSGITCPKNKICNPTSGRCVSKTGAIGKKILGK